MRQRDATDCGPSCIASVMAHYGLWMPVSRLRQEARTDHRGTSMKGVVDTLEKVGFEARGLKGEAGHLIRVPVPFIAHLVRPDQTDHYVAVYRVRPNSLRVMDPASGRMEQWDRDRFESQWSGALVALVPSGGPVLPEHTGKPEHRLLNLLRPIRIPFMQAAISGLLYTVLGLSTSLYVGKITDHVLVSGNRGLLNLMSLAMAAIILLMMLLSLSRQGILLRAGQVIDNQLIASYYRHLLRLPQRFFDQMKSGEILSRITDAVKIRVFINETVVGLGVNLLILVFSYLLMFLIHPRLAWLMSGMLPLQALIFFLFNRRNRRVEREVMEKSALLEDQLVESLEGARFIRQFRLERMSGERTERRLNSLLDAVFQSGSAAIWAATGSDTLNRYFTLFLLWTGSFLVLGGELSPGELLSFYALTGYFTGPVTALVNANKAFQNARIASDRLFEIFQLEPDETPERRAFRASDFGDICLQSVSFSYGSRGEQIRDASLCIPAGRITVLTGPSGSGKSTISGLIQHLYRPDRGVITIGGTDTRPFSGESIRKLLGVVPQEPVFFRGSILENLAPGDRDPDLARITRLLAQVQLLELVESMPEGVESPLMARGCNLSGGERQRLALARALYHQPRLLILDEATSSLDPRSEAAVHHLLLSLREAAVSLFLITHKEHLASLADFAYRIEEGRISVY